MTPPTPAGWVTCLGATPELTGPPARWTTKQPLLYAPAQVLGDEPILQMMTQGLGGLGPWSCCWSEGSVQGQVSCDPPLGLSTGSLQLPKIITLAKCLFSWAKGSPPLTQYNNLLDPTS